MGQAATVLRCSVCQREAPAGADSCPEHGTTLVEMDPFLERIISRRYRLVRCVGRGGMGAVYEGRHIHTDQRVAVKVLAPHLSRDLKLVARFRREAMASSRLRHENCVQVHDFGEDDDGTFFIAMELVDGAGIGDEIRRSGAMPAARVARVGVQLLGALEAAHTSGILHRDLKPQNIMLTQLVGRPDFVKVVDFGIAKFVENSPEDQAALTVPGTIFGTPEYMSPEQARGDTLDGRSDLYSAAVVLWHMLLGRSPYRGKTVRETLLKVFRESPPRASQERPAEDGLPALEDALLVALAKEPGERYPDAAAFRQALLPFTDESLKAIARDVLPGKSDDGSAPPTTLGLDAAPAPTPSREPERKATLLTHGAAPPMASSEPPPTEPQAPGPQDLPFEPPGDQEELASPDAVTAPLEAVQDAALEAALGPDPATEPHTSEPITLVAPLEALPPPPPEGSPKPRSTPSASSSLRPSRLTVLVVGGGALVGLALGALTFGIVRALRDGGPPAAEIAEGPASAAGAQGTQGLHEGQGGPPSPADEAARAPDEDGWIPLEGFPSRRSPTESLRLASAALAGEDLDAAAMAYDEALRRDPGNAAALQGLAMVAYRRGDLESAKRYLEELMQLGEEHARQFRDFYRVVSRKLEAQR